MTNKTNTNGVYIQSIEASLIWESMNRGTKIKNEYFGSIPYSLQLIKLRAEGLNEFTIRNKKNEEGKVVPTKTDIKELDKRTVKEVTTFMSDDIISVKFNGKVNNASTTLSKIDKAHLRQLEALQIKHEELLKDNTNKEEMQAEFAKEIEEFKNRHEQRMADLKVEMAENTDVWNKTVSLFELRTELYENGFTLTNYKGEEVKYLPFQRSSAKARTGQILFIKEELAETMINWSRMGLNFEGKTDIPALSSYEALTSSAIKGTVKINPKNILLVDDVESVFQITANVVEKITVDGQDILKSSVKDNQTIKNSLFDGQGMLDAKYFTGQYEGKGYILTRQHFFKSALFNTNIVDFMKDQFGEEYETAKIKDMLGNNIKVKDIECIITPSSLKVFKFSYMLGSDKEMYKHWKNLVKAEKNVFGVCKNESTTKLGYENGMPLQQMSYQMINSLGLSLKDMQILSKNEVDYINDLKSDDDKFVQHLKENITLTNSHAMMADLFDQNNEFAKTELFNTYKIEVIKAYVQHIKKGKVRVTGDYAVMIGNAYEMLLHAVGKLDLNNPTLKGNEVCSTLFKDGEELAGFRNPHTSANNILFAKNRLDANILKYMNLTDNIVVVNVINFPILDTLSGADFDSDTALFTINEIIVNVARNNKELVCLNGVDAEKNEYDYTEANKALVDDKIASDVIGRIVNVGQLAQSVMYDALANGKTEVYDNMKEVVEIISVASGIAIDLAKRTYAIDVEKELVRLDTYVRGFLKEKKKKEDDKEVVVKLFPAFMCGGKNKSRKPANYKTTMDFLVNIFTVANTEVSSELDIKIKRAKELKTKDIVDVWELVMKCDPETGEKFYLDDANHKQRKEILDMVEDYTLKIKTLYARVHKATDNGKDSIFREMNDIAQAFETRMKKKTIKPVTLHSILSHLFNKQVIEVDRFKVLNALYMSNEKTFVNSFIQN